MAMGRDEVKGRNTENGPWLFSIQLAIPAHTSDLWLSSILMTISVYREDILVIRVQLQKVESIDRELGLITNPTYKGNVCLMRTS